MNASYMETYRPKGMSLSELCRAAAIECPCHLSSMTIKGVTSHSERVGEGWLFVALRGRRQNGLDYLGKAYERGAVLCVTEDTPPSDAPMPCLQVDDAREVLSYLCDAWFEHPSNRLRMVGITGTNGKTSVSCMISHILQKAGIPCGVIGTVGCVSPQGEILQFPSADPNAHMTTPDPEELYPMLSMMADEERGAVVVMEVTSHALALKKTIPIDFEVGIFTNLTPEHLDFHGDMENYFKAKSKLFASVRKAIINAQDMYGRRLAEDASLSVETYDLCYSDPSIIHEVQLNTHCRRVYAQNLTDMGIAGVSYTLVAPYVRMRILCQVPGEFSVINSMQATLAALALGVSPHITQASMASFRGVVGRMERVKLPMHMACDVLIDYAHTPDALSNLLLTVSRIKRRHQRMVLLFGCGGDRDPSKRAVMGRIASQMADMVILTSDNSRTEDPQKIISQIQEGMVDGCDYVVIPNRKDAIFYAIRYARKHDIILLAGKGHETYEIDHQGMHDFCERDIVIEAVKKYFPG